MHQIDQVFNEDLWIIVVGEGLTLDTRQSAEYIEACANLGLPPGHTTKDLIDWLGRKLAGAAGDHSENECKLEIIPGVCLFLGQTTDYQEALVWGANTFMVGVWRKDDGYAAVVMAQNTPKGLALKDVARRGMALYRAELDSMGFHEDSGYHRLQMRADRRQWFLKATETAQRSGGG
jgi:hypothetical protein